MERKVPTTFYRLRTECVQATHEDKHATVILPKELANKLKKGNGLVLADWHEGIYTGKAKKIAIVDSIDPSNSTANVVYADIHLSLEPSPQGRQFWRNEFFCFAKNVVEKYRLKQVFTQKFIA